MSDRVTAALLLLLAVGFGYAGWQFTTSFFSDPLGPRAVPLATAASLVPLAVYLWIRPEQQADWPPGRTWLPLGIGVVGFVAYALVLEPLGFVLATTLFFIVFSRLFEAKLWQGTLTGVLLSAALYVVFVWGLDLYLPTGQIFERFF